MVIFLDPLLKKLEVCLAKNIEFDTKRDLTNRTILHVLDKTFQLSMTVVPAGTEIAVHVAITPPLIDLPDDQWRAAKTELHKITKPYHLSVSMSDVGQACSVYGTAEGVGNYTDICENFKSPVYRLRIFFTEEYDNFVRKLITLGINPLSANSN